jgi:hypothetical protein
MRKHIVMCAVGVLVASLPAVSLIAAPLPPQPQYGANTIAIRKQCLSDDALDIIRSIRSLKRKTSLEDPDLPFNPDYLVGTWHLDWINSEVPWSSAGPNTGTITFKYVENCNYEGLMDATGPDGKYTVKIQLLWRPREKHLTWIEADSRGFTVIREGDIGGHGPTSQQFDYLWEAVPFIYQGKLIRMVGSMFITGPNNARQDVVISIDGGKTQRLGAPSIERDQPAGSATPN